MGGVGRLPGPPGIRASVLLSPVCHLPLDPTVKPAGSQGSQGEPRKAVQGPAPSGCGAGVQEEAGTSVTSALAASPVSVSSHFQSQHW